MSTCKYLYDLPSIEQSNETLINKKVIRVLDCKNNINANELCNLWNFSHCPNDDDYCQPFVKGDFIYKQFFTPRNYFSYSFVHIIDTATGEDIVTAQNPLTVETGYDKNDNYFANLIIDTSKLDNIQCFYLKIVGFTCRFKEPKDITDFNQCVKDLKDAGYSTQEAQETCLNSMCPDSKETLFSEPYCIVKCQDTILIEGFYPSYDCNGNFYGKFTSGSATNSFKPQLRIFGWIEPAEFLIEEIVVNTKRKSTKQIKSVNLLSKKVPFYVVERLANIFSSQKVFVEGEEYLRATSISKNNDEGLMWIVRTTLQQECDSTNFTCQ